MSTNNGNQFTGYYRQSGYPYQSATNQVPAYMQPAVQGNGFAQTAQGGFAQMYPQMPSGMTVQTPGAGTSGPQVPGMLPVEQSYIENILRLNKGKLATVYMAFEGSNEWNSKVFRGVVEAAGRDHLILSDPETGYRYLLPMVYFNYAVFEEELEYDYPFGVPQATTYAPR
ncbi:spore coat protein GerQ [Caldibacillus lycopersici]|uniref:Spore coat protein GerQ n=1 Tax=Perspicuibacillus lycopersici TaxID=1325689 RepID=A0AAE3IWH4_9BACI|nr:spore coat protein GerQ [Perspicuibacillus lycopersici]MCU9613350.1 spore coat protein GerQ [Perspicuibacillus lycopersici]